MTLTPADESKVVKRARASDMIEDEIWKKVLVAVEGKRFAHSIKGTIKAIFDNEDWGHFAIQIEVTQDELLDALLGPARAEIHGGFLLTDSPVKLPWSLNPRTFNYTLTCKTPKKMTREEQVYMMKDLVVEVEEGDPVYAVEVDARVAILFKTYTNVPTEGVVGLTCQILQKIDVLPKAPKIEPADEVDDFSSIFNEEVSRMKEN